jgi:hypothetical protein
MSSEGWLNRSIVRYFQHRCAEHALRGLIDGAGKNPDETRRLALSDTINSFRGNGLNWSESHITEIVEAIPESSDRLEWIGSVYPAQEVATFAVTLCHCHSGELVTLYTTAPDLETAIEWSDFYCQSEWGRLGVADIRTPAMLAKGAEA